MEAHHLFPTTVWTHDLSELAEHYEGWIEVLDRKRESEDGGSGRSTRHGWSGPKTLFEDIVFKPLHDACEKVFGEVLKDMNLPEGFRFAMEAWGNIQDPNGYNKLHIHRDAIVSGVFYLEMPEGCGGLLFQDPRPGAYFSRPFQHTHNRFKEILLKPKVGDLVIFPNWLQHSVEPNDADSARYSIAVNAIFPLNK